MEAVLHSLGFAILAIDFAKLDPGSDTGRLLLSPIKRRTIGLTHRKNQFATVELPVQFDGLLYIDTTSHTRLLPQVDP